MHRHNPCILIVYSCFGDGHLQAARAIQQAFAAQGIRQVHLVDLLAEAHPHWNSISRFSYLKSSAHFPQIYGFSYHVTNQAKPHPVMNRLFHSIGKHKMKQLVRLLRPDAVIHTFPYLAMPELNAEHRFNIPTFTVLTDYVLHSRWIHKHVTRYFVASGHLRESFIRSGLTERQISVTGIPIRKAFEGRLNREVLCGRLGLDSRKKYVLLSAGAYGVLAHVRKMIGTIKADTGFDILLVCGKNKNLYQTLETELAGEPRIRVMGFVERMEELMAVSYCLLTKAGGITLTEALAMRLPTIVYRPLPGQEKGNAEYLAKQGAVCITNDLSELSRQLQLLELESARRKMASAAKAVHRPAAAERIVAEVLEAAGQTVPAHSPVFS